MKTVIVDDRIGHRGRRTANLLFCPGRGIVEFTGQDIPPALQVVKKEYTKNGKWSHNTWTVKILETMELKSFSQDWGTGEWFPVRTWEEAYRHLDTNTGKQLDSMGITLEMTQRAIRSIFPQSADKIDQAIEAFNLAGDALNNLFAAQKELHAAKLAEKEVMQKVRAMEQAELMRQEAEQTQQRVEQAKELMKDGKAINLADLKAALQMN